MNNEVSTSGCFPHIHNGSKWYIQRYKNRLWPIVVILYNKRLICKCPLNQEFDRISIWNLTRGQGPQANCGPTPGYLPPPSGPGPASQPPMVPPPCWPDLIGPDWGRPAGTQPCTNSCIEPLVSHKPTEMKSRGVLLTISIKLFQNGLNNKENLF